MSNTPELLHTPEDSPNDQNIVDRSDIDSARPGEEVPATPAETTDLAAATHPAVQLSPGDMATPALTPEQSDFINHWSFGPFFGWLYFLAMEVWKPGIILFIWSIFGPLAVYFCVSIFVGLALKALGVQINQFGSPTTFFLMIFGSGAVVALLAQLGIAIWAMRRGRAYAWHHRHWSDFETFARTQKIWDKIAIGWLILNIGLIALAVVTTLPRLAALSALPSSTLGSQSDTTSQSQVALVGHALSTCGQANRGQYFACSSVNQLVYSGYLANAQNLGDVYVSVSDDGSGAIAAAELSPSTRSCGTGSHNNFYYVYATNYPTVNRECWAVPPHATGVASPTPM